MELFANLDKGLQIKILVEYLGKFKYEDGMLKPKYIPPEVLNQFNAVYARIPKLQLSFREWSEYEQDANHIYSAGQMVEYVKREYYVCLSITAATDPHNAYYVLKYTDERKYIEDTDIYSIYVNTELDRTEYRYGRRESYRYQPRYELIGGYGRFEAHLVDNRENFIVENKLYNIMWNHWELRDGDEDWATDDYDEELAEFEAEMNYDNYEEYDD